MQHQSKLRKLINNVARTELLKEAKIDSAEINGETVYFQGSKPQLVKPEKIDKPDDKNLNKTTPSELADSAIEDFNSMITDLDFANLKGEKIRGVEVKNAVISGDDLILEFNVGKGGEDEIKINLNNKKAINSILGDYLKSIYGSDANIDKAIFNLRDKQADIKTIKDAAIYPTVGIVPPHLRKK